MDKELIFSLTYFFVSISAIGFLYYRMMRMANEVLKRQEKEEAERKLKKCL